MSQHASATTVFEHDTFPAEQFEDAHQQSHAVTLGMWTFLATEVLFFGVLFATFYIYRLRYPADFADAARELKWYLGALNTAVLLASSYTMALAVHAAKESDDPRPLLRFLLLTLLLGLCFLGIKFTEYAIEYRDQLIPTLHFSMTAPDGAPRPAHTPLFMTLYFCTTLLHALHMVVGLSVVCVIAWLARRRHFSRAYHNPVETLGLYWHFVDIVWVFLFPTLYLLRQP